MFNEVDICVPPSLLNLSYKMYVPDISLLNIPYFDKSGLVAGGKVFNVPLMYAPIRIHHLIKKYFGKETQETKMRNQYVDKDVPDILYDMLTNSQFHKENNDVTFENNFVSDDDHHVHEDVEIDIVVAHLGVVNNHNDKVKFASKGKKDHAVEDVDKDVETLWKDVESNDEIIFLGCAINRKVYLLFIKGTQYIDDVHSDMNPLEDEYFDLIGLDIQQVIADKTGNIMLSTEEDGTLHDAETFAHISYLRAIKLLLKLSCILKFKIYHMDMKSSFLNRYLMWKSIRMLVII